MVISSSPHSNTNGSGQKQKIKVMLVDDSALIRKILTQTLEKEDDFEIVASTNNGKTAINHAMTSKPDVIILDIEMPVMDGLTALPQILEASPNSKVIMFSSLTEKGASITLKALSLGAVECFAKPTSREFEDQTAFQEKIVHTIRELALQAKPPLSRQAQAPQTAVRATTSFSLYDDTASYKGKPDIIAIGSSTGGPHALFEVLRHFTSFDIPTVITQHMPPTFTRILAEHIADKTGVPAHEGQQNMALDKGHIYIAPGGKHMVFKGNNKSASIELNDGPPENFCKPSVNPMFRSAVELFGRKVLAVILTGMGHDGLEAAKELVSKGGRLIAQDEASSVVWGMPGAVAQAGICSHVLPLKEIGPWIKKAVVGV